MVTMDPINVVGSAEGGAVDFSGADLTALVPAAGLAVERRHEESHKIIV